MLPFISLTFQNLLLNILQLAVGCIFPLCAYLLKKRGISIVGLGHLQKSLVVIATSFAGMLLPLGPFGAVPVVAALCMTGLELPLALPLVVSSFIFNMSMPLTETVFVWNGNIARIAAAFAAGVLAGLLLSLRKKDVQDIIRKSTYRQFFSGQQGTANYFIVLKNYIEAAGLYIIAGAILRAAFSADVSYWLQNQFLTSDVGLATMTSLSRLNVFNPVFGASVLVLGRLIDFSALAGAAFLLRPKSIVMLYLYYVLLALFLAAGLFLK